jgi:hypothetical protein
MEREALFFLTVVVVSLLTLSVMQYRSPLVISPLDIERTNNDASDIIIGSVSEILEIERSECFINNTLKFIIDSVEKSADLSSGDVIMVSYITQDDPVPFDCISGQRLARVFEGDYLTLYLNKKGNAYELVLKGDSVVCSGCSANNGQCPVIGKRFGLDETLTLFKIPTTPSPLRENIDKAQGSYCSPGGKMRYYTQFNKKCQYDYECIGNACRDSVCVFENPEEPEEVVPESEQVIASPESEETVALPSLSIWERILDWFF